MRKRVKIIAPILAVPLAAASLLAGYVLREFGKTPQDLSAYTHGKDSRCEVR